MSIKYNNLKHKTHNIHRKSPSLLIKTVSSWIKYACLYISNKHNFALSKGLPIIPWLWSVKMTQGICRFKRPPLDQGSTTYANNDWQIPGPAKSYSTQYSKRISSKVPNLRTPCNVNLAIISPGASPRPRPPSDILSVSELRRGENNDKILN